MQEKMISTGLEYLEGEFGKNRVSSAIEAVNKLIRSTMADCSDQSLKNII